MPCGMHFKTYFVVPRFGRSNFGTARRLNALVNKSNRFARFGRAFFIYVHFFAIAGKTTA